MSPWGSIPGSNFVHVLRKSSIVGVFEKSEKEQGKSGNNKTDNNLLTALRLMSVFPFSNKKCKLPLFQGMFYRGQYARLLLSVASTLGSNRCGAGHSSTLTSWRKFQQRAGFAGFWNSADLSWQASGMRSENKAGLMPEMPARGEKPCVV